MKIRMGFVANSSSSCFIIATKFESLTLNSLVKMIQKWFQFERFRDKDFKNLEQGIKNELNIKLGDDTAVHLARFYISNIEWEDLSEMEVNELEDCEAHIFVPQVIQEKEFNHFYIIEFDFHHIFDKFWVEIYEDNFFLCNSELSGFITELDKNKLNYNHSHIWE